MTTNPVYAFCICHESLKAQWHDSDSGKLTIDIRGWDERKQSPCSTVDYHDFKYLRLTIQAWYSTKFSGVYGQNMGLDMGHDLLTIGAIAFYLKPMKALERKLNAIEKKYGSAKTVGQSLAYVADALGITQFIRPNTRREHGWQSTTETWIAIAWCDDPITQFHEDHKEQERATHVA
jgi:hypothetical protein